MIKIFKRKKENKPLYGWDKLPIKYLPQITRITQNKILSEEDKILRCTALINNINYDELLNYPISKTQELIKTVNFLYTEPKKKKLVKNLNLNGKEYYCNTEIKDITTLQFIEYNSLMEDMENNLPQLLSLFIMPKGHKYNENYNVKEVVEDINNYLSVEEGLSIANFFIKEYRRYVTHTLSYLERMLWAVKVMKKKQLNQTTIMMIEKKIEDLKRIRKETHSIFG